MMLCATPRPPVRNRSVSLTAYRRAGYLCSFLLSALALIPTPRAATAAPGSGPVSQRIPGRPNLLGIALHRPLAFEPNVGQVRSCAAFVARGSTYSVQLASNELIVALRGAGPSPFPPAGLFVEAGNDRRRYSAARARLQAADAVSPALIRFGFAGMSPAASVRGEEIQAGWTNYITGDDPRNWRTCVPTYGKVVYDGVYPGVQCVVYGNEGRIEYDFVVGPRADYRAIGLSIAGSDSVRIDDVGDLVLGAGASELRMPRPFVYQNRAGSRAAVDARYVLEPARSSVADFRIVRFDVGTYDATLPLIIDPTIVYSTYIGGGNSPYGNVYGWDMLVDATTDKDGNAYVTGESWAVDYPAQGALQGASGGDWDVVISKLSADGSSLLYSTYLGGSGDDEGGAIRVDDDGNIYVAGLTSSANFPTANAYSATNSGYDAFVVKLDSTGTTLQYSSYFGGAGEDLGLSLALLPGNQNVLYATGLTASSDLPVVDAYQASFGGGTYDGFLIKVDTGAAGAASLLYSTYLGKGGDDRAIVVHTDDAGRAYLAGATSSTDFPVAQAYQPSYAGGAYDGFVCAFNASGSSLRYSTFLGGSGEDRAIGLDVDSSDRAYVAGRTASGDFPTSGNAYDTSCGTDGTCNGGVFDAFVARLSASGGSLSYSTYIGGSGLDRAVAVSADPLGRAYVAGRTTSSADFPLASPVQSNFGGGDADAFVTKLNPAGTALIYSTYLGGSSPDPGWYEIPSEEAQSIVADSKGNATVVGYTWSNDWPTHAPYQASNAGEWDGFVVKLNDPPSADLQLSKTDGPDPIVAGGTLTYSLTISNSGPDAATSVTTSDPLPGSVTLVSVTASQGSCSGASSVTCDLGTVASGDSATVTIAVRPTAGGSLTNTASVTAAEGDPDVGNNSASATTTVTEARGDSNGDGVVTVADVFFLINHLFAGGQAPATSCGGDANADGAATVADVFFLINFLFAGGLSPASC